MHFKRSGIGNEYEPINSFNMTLIVCVMLATSVEPATGLSDWENCMEGCDIMLMICIRRSCPGRSWPLPVRQKCVEELSRCIEQCAREYRRP
ncbi:hypothetical protein LSAT2_017865 [Lamellibrachia satsuma]|nr:hypothetical protein LSAT2_017865 [Lamellibrachia satsuma]